MGCGFRSKTGKEGRRIRLAGWLVILAAAACAFGQGQAGRGTASTTIGVKKVSIDYGQLELKGRKFADLMKQLPGDRVWRGGSGAATILSTGPAAGRSAAW